MAKGEMDELKQKKLELEAELNDIYHELDSSFDKVRTEVSSQLNPKRWIRDYPLVSVGASALAGFLMGYQRRSHKGSHKRKRHKGDTITDTVIDGLKGIAAKKAINMTVNFVEKRLGGKG